MAAALQLEARNAHISRIRSVVVADAIDTHINNTGSIRSNLQPALEELARDFPTKDVRDLTRWRKAGEWLLEFFQHVPLGAIYMMDKQTILWGNNVTVGYVAPIVAYCRSLPDFVSHAKELTPAACAAVVNWANGCAYHMDPGSSLRDLVQRQEQVYASTNTAGSISHAITGSERPREVSQDDREEVLEPYFTATANEIAPDQHSEIDEAPVSWDGDVVQLVGRDIPPRALSGKGVDNSSVIRQLPSTATGNMAASGSDKELLLASQPTSTPTTLLYRGFRAGSGHNDKAEPSTRFYSPPPPQALLVHETMLRIINVYFEDSCRNMMFDENGILLSQDGTELRNDLCTDFDSYCFTATMLKEKGLQVDFGRTLCRAFDLVKPILRAEHPRTLACFFEVLMHLMQTGLSEVAFVLRGFIKRMSAEIGGLANLWSRICQLLGEVDRENFAHAIARGWRCTTDVFDRVLGSSHRLAVSVRLDYVKRVMIADHLEEEQLLRNLLARFEETPEHPIPRVMLNLAHNLNRQDRHGEAERMALDVWCLLQRHEIYAERKVEKMESLKVISRSQFAQGKSLEAEQSIRMVISMVVDQWGHEHPWVNEFMNVLDDWLRAWGRDEDSNALASEISRSVGRHVIEEGM